MRVGEQAGLNCEDIDFREGVLHVRRNFTRSGVLKLPKGDREGTCR